MKLVWFARSTFRLHIGGHIVVTNPSEVPDGIDPHELTSGADTVLRLDDNTLPPFEKATWSERRPVRPIDADSTAEPPMRLFRFGDAGLFVDPPGEPALILTPPAADWARFADGAVVVLAGPFADLVVEATALCRVARPRLVALATGIGEADDLADIAGSVAGAAVMVMEPGLALEA